MSTPVARKLTTRSWSGIAESKLAPPWTWKSPEITPAGSSAVASDSTSSETCVDCPGARSTSARSRLANGPRVAYTKKRPGRQRQIQVPVHGRARGCRPASRRRAAPAGNAAGEQAVEAGRGRPAWWPDRRRGSPPARRSVAGTPGDGLDVDAQVGRGGDRDVADVVRAWSPAQTNWPGRPASRTRRAGRGRSGWVAARPETSRRRPAPPRSTGSRRVGSSGIGAEGRLVEQQRGRASGLAVHGRAVRDHAARDRDGGVDRRGPGDARAAPRPPPAPAHRCPWGGDGER